MPFSLSEPAAKLIDLESVLRDKPYVGLLRSLIGPAENMLAINKINKIHCALPANGSVGDFCRSSLKALDIEYALTEQELDSIPASGPLVMVSNHPYGGIEGIILAEVLLQVRPDVRILGNYLLTYIPALASHIIPLDPMNPKKSARFNARGLKQAINWVANGGALLTFPAGEVSHLQLRNARIEDAPWSPHIAKLILKTKAKALPVYTHGRNSILFNLMGTIHPRLRTLLLPREMTNKTESLIQLSVGSSIGWRKLSEFETLPKAAEFLRLNTYFLKHRIADKRRWIPLPIPHKSIAKARKPIIAPVPKARLVREVRSLDLADRLVDQKGYSVYATTAERSPSIMREIGRLREASFRDVSEGTGLSLDIDAFDDHYIQIFLWNNATQEIAGAYRMGQSDRILPQSGTEGLYTSTLFKYKPHFLSHLNQALELGRSFIRTAYQRKFGCLSILWRGIGEFVARNTQYRYLFGPVSISKDYHTISRNLMVAFLSHYAMDQKMARLVTARRPVKKLKSVQRTVPFNLLEKDALEDISMLISEVENDNKGVPTLIKHYLKLNGQFLAFNLDKDFANVIDGLIWVDLLKTDPKIIARFLGPQGTIDFHHRHDPKLRIQAA